MGVNTPQVAIARPPVAAGPQQAPPHRQAWIDNLRVAVITGVIGAHVTLIYALDVAWYYEERAASTVAKALLAAIFSPGLLFGMGLMFFVAGIFTPGALTSKGPRHFVADRLVRLGAPTLAYLFVVNPFMNFVGDHASGQGEGIADYFRRTYLDDVEFGVAWFITALLLFSVGYAVWRSRHPAPARSATPLRRADLIRAVVLIATASFAVRLVWPFLGGDVIGLSLWEYPQMVTLFALGVHASERGWIDHGLPRQLRRDCGRAAIASLLAVMALAVLIVLSDDADPFVGGLHPEAVAIPLIEGTIAVTMSLWLTDWFRRRLNRATNIAHAAGRASFVAYLAHAPISVLLAVAIRDVGLPAEAKFVLVFAATIALAFGAGALMTREHHGGRIL